MVAGRLPDEHDLRVQIPAARDGLRARGVQRASRARHDLIVVVGAEFGGALRVVRVHPKAA